MAVMLTFCVFQVFQSCLLNVQQEGLLNEVCLVFVLGFFMGSLLLVCFLPFACHF